MDSVKPGMTTDDIEKIIHEYYISERAYPSCFGLNNYPKSVCISVNEVVTHGLPMNYEIQEGDYINVDTTCYYDGYHGDTSGMILVGEVEQDIEYLSNVTREALWTAIGLCKPGVPLEDLG